MILESLNFEVLEFKIWDFKIWILNNFEVRILEFELWTLNFEVFWNLIFGIERIGWMEFLNLSLETLIFDFWIFKFNKLKRNEVLKLGIEIKT